MENLLHHLERWLETPWILTIVIVGGAIIAAYVIAFVMSRTLGALSKRTQTDLDDSVYEALRRPVLLSVILYGLSVAADVPGLPIRANNVLQSLLATIAVLIWSGAAFRVGHALLDSVSRRAQMNAVVQPRTLPIFDILVKGAVVGAAVYFTFLAWHIDVTAWLASAGIIGVALGFAAQDSLANLFAGIFIAADAPYKTGDWIVLDQGLRGYVTRIGMRSTRIITRDDVEITVPNSVIGGARILNEAGGPSPKQRIRATVEAAYGSDLDRVHEVLRQVGEAQDVCKQPAPQVRFTSFGASGLVHELQVWIDDPATKESAIHELNSAIYKAFAAAGIEIPYSKHDVYIKELPRANSEPRRLQSL